MSGPLWCDRCQDHFAAGHYDRNDNHLVGDEYGPTGAEMAELRGA